MVVLVLAGTNVPADTEIYRCSLEDGTIAFQETPCITHAEDIDKGSEDGTPAADDDAFDFVNPFDEPELPKPASESRAECEKKTRDAIDAIDLEMQGNAYTRERGAEYLAELLVLTQRLRSCKQL